MKSRGIWSALLHPEHYGGLSSTYEFNLTQPPLHPYTHTHTQRPTMSCERKCLLVWKILMNRRREENFTFLYEAMLCSYGAPASAIHYVSGVFFQI